MSKICILIIGSAVGSAVLAVEPVGRPVSAVTAPLESVTVNEASVRAAISPMPRSQSQLFAHTRSGR